MKKILRSIVLGSFTLTSLSLLAEEAAKSASTQQPSFMEGVLPFVFIFVAMYFIMIRPQAKKAKDHANLLKNLKNGDEVVTSGGIIGKVKHIADDFITLEVGSNHMKILKDHIAGPTKKAAEKAPASTAG